MSCFYIKQVRQRTKRFKQPSLWISAFNHTHRHTHTHTHTSKVCVQEFLFVASVGRSHLCICRTATTTNEAVCHLSPCRFFSDRSHIVKRFYSFVRSIKLSLCCIFMFLIYPICRAWGLQIESCSLWVPAVWLVWICKAVVWLVWELQLSVERPDASFLIIGCVHVLRRAGIRQFYL